VESESGGVTAAWLGGLVLSGIGFGLGVIALTLPWVSVQSAPTSSTSLSPEQLWLIGIGDLAPLFALLLVVTALITGIGFATGRRSGRAHRYAAVLWAPAPATVALFVGLHPGTRALRQAANAEAGTDLVTSPLIGVVLFAAGLLLIGVGVAIGLLNSPSRVTVVATVPTVFPRAYAVWVRWVALVMAIPVVVASASLPWYRVDNVSPDMSTPAITPSPAYWQEIYRIGLVIAAMLLVATAIATPSIRAVLRAIGLFVGGALLTNLAINAFLLWNPDGMISQFYLYVDAVHLGSGYLAAVGAVLLLLIVMTTLAPVGPVPEETAR
jgi:hypothetical protein